MHVEWPVWGFVVSEIHLFAGISESLNSVFCESDFYEICGVFKLRNMVV